MLQQTIMRPIKYTGIGLHSGKEVALKLIPAPANSGISFHIHTAKKVHIIKPSADVVLATTLATTLGKHGDDKAQISTVEHLLAALMGLKIDNVECHVQGSEIPIMDGSALPITNLIKKTGIRSQYALRTVAKITRPISFEENGKIIHARPYNGFYVDYTIDFKHPSIGLQRFTIDITPESFHEIAHARTFGFVKEVEYLHKNNLALGGSLQNAIVLDDECVINPEGLRCPDEFVRHKVLDFLGDMAMFGTPLYGAFEVHCSGHHHNNMFLRSLQENPSSLDYVELAPEHEISLFPSFSLKPSYATQAHA